MIFNKVNNVVGAWNFLCEIFQSFHIISDWISFEKTKTLGKTIIRMTYYIRMSYSAIHCTKICSMNIVHVPILLLYLVSTHDLHSTNITFGMMHSQQKKTLKYSNNNLLIVQCHYTAILKDSTTKKCERANNVINLNIRLPLGWF